MHTVYMYVHVHVIAKTHNTHIMSERKEAFYATLVQGSFYETKNICCVHRSQILSSALDFLQIITTHNFPYSFSALTIHVCTLVHYTL